MQIASCRDIVYFDASVAATDIEKLKNISFTKATAQDILLQSQVVRAGDNCINSYFNTEWVE
jgi:hypothetical protein